MNNGTKKTFFVCFLVFWAVGVQVLWGGTWATCSDTTATKNQQEQEEEEKVSFFNRDFPFIVLPVAYYSPETEYAGGIAGVYSFRLGGDADSLLRPSTVALAGIYTARRQLIAEIRSRFFWDNNASYLKAEAKYLRFPDFFWGVGGSTPTDAQELFSSEIAIANVSYGREFWQPALYGGFLYEGEYYKTTETAANGLLETGDIIGAAGAIVSGVGIFANYDSRDNIFFTTGGAYWYGEMTAFMPALGSEFTFQRWLAEGRLYHAFSQQSVLGLHALFTAVNGTTPFQKLARLGGDKIMRGIYDGRFRDNISLACQAEYRYVPFLWRIGFAAFAGVGTVAPNIENILGNTLHLTGGFGFRFVFDQKDRLHARMDIGFSKEGGKLYISLNEAF